MASPSPSAASPASQTLPMSNQHVVTTTTGGTGTATEPPQPTAFRALFSHFSESLRNGLSQRRPWSELTDRTAFSKPLSFSEATLRIRHNVSYFRINYYVVVSLILAISLLSNPFSLILLFSLLASWLFLYLLRPSDQPLHLLGRTFSDFETLSLLAATTFFILFFSSLGSLLVTAFTTSVALVAAHSAFRVPEDLFLDERESTQPAGFLSILRAAAATRA